MFDQENRIVRLSCPGKVLVTSIFECIYTPKRLQSIVVYFEYSSTKINFPRKNIFIIEKGEHNQKYQLVLAHPVKEDGSLIAANMAVF